MIHQFRLCVLIIFLQFVGLGVRPDSRRRRRFCLWSLLRVFRFRLRLATDMRDETIGAYRAKELGGMGRDGVGLGV